MKDKPYPITGHACFYPKRSVWWGDSSNINAALRRPLLAPKAVVKRATKKKGKK